MPDRQDGGANHTAEALRDALEQVHDDLRDLKSQRQETADHNVGLTDQRTFQLLVSVIQMLLIPWLAWVTIVIQSNQRDIAVLMESRFSGEQGVAIQGDVSRLQSDVSELEREVQRLRRRLDGRTP